MILHLVSRSPFENNALEQCLKLANNDDSIVLMGDGVLAAQHPQMTHATVKGIFAVADDLALRGVALTSNSPIKVITMNDLVGLTVEHASSHTWF